MLNDKNSVLFKHFGTKCSNLANKMVSKIFYERETKSHMQPSPPKELPREDSILFRPKVNASISGDCEVRCPHSFRNVSFFTLLPPVSPVAQVRTAVAEQSQE